MIELQCSAEVVQKRLQRDTGGDRAERKDDALELVLRKLATYEHRTRPLVRYYEESGARRIIIPSGENTTAEWMAQEVEKLPCPE